MRMLWTVGSVGGVCSRSVLGARSLCVDGRVKVREVGGGGRCVRKEEYEETIVGSMGWYSKTWEAAYMWLAAGKSAMVLVIGTGAQWTTEARWGGN